MNQSQCYCFLRSFLLQRCEARRTAPATSSAPARAHIANLTTKSRSPLPWPLPDQASNLFPRCDGVIDRIPFCDKHSLHLRIQEHSQKDPCRAPRSHHAPVDLFRNLSSIEAVQPEWCQLVSNFWSRSHELGGGTMVASSGSLALGRMLRCSSNVKAYPSLSCD